MDIKQLRYFAKIVELKSITSAAEALFIAQPSLSQHMTNLENEVGIKLLNRSTHGTQATKLGLVLYGHAKTILRQLEDANAALRSESGAPSGRVAIGFPSSTSRMVAATLLRELFTLYPRIELEIVEGSSGELLELVASGRLDLAVTMNVRNDPRVRVVPVLQEELFALMPNSPPPPASLCVEELAGYPLLLPTRPNSVRMVTERLFSEKSLPLRLIAETSAVEVLISAVEAGLGITILSAAAFLLAQKQGRLVGVPIEGRPFVRELSVSTSLPGVSSDVVRYVHELLLAVVRNEVTDGRWSGVTLIDPR